ncbi:hypothetical protein DWU99_02045 [Dyella psychrodurans]|uniref:Uncharacterized protein n=1 Tax=Dyella psychrodurans TaxID=1927960 RepID=A0A370XCU3_9GAMM|nr:hypothetical protein DWU99_02045 [Dyella psychrodurans]
MDAIRCKAKPIAAAVGYKRINNASRFPDFHGGDADGNYAYCLLGDYQLIQTDTAQSFRVFYVNVKTD